MKYALSTWQQPFTVRCKRPKTKKLDDLSYSAQNGQGRKGETVSNRISLIVRRTYYVHLRGSRVTHVEFCTRANFSPFSTKQNNKQHTHSVIFVLSGVLLPRGVRKSERGSVMVTRKLRSSRQKGTLEKRWTCSFRTGRPRQSSATSGTTQFVTFRTNINTSNETEGAKSYDSVCMDKQTRQAIKSEIYDYRL